MSALAVSSSDGARPARGVTRHELDSRVEALALAVGSRITASALMVAAIIVILLGAQSMLGAMDSMARDVDRMNEQLAIANRGLVVLNDAMDSVPATGAHEQAILREVKATHVQVGRSRQTLTSMNATTQQLNTRLGRIATNTRTMRGSLDRAAASTTTLSGTIGTLNTKIDPLVRTQHSMYLGTTRMRAGLDAMNASLAYVVRVMSFIANPPPTMSQGFQMRADLDKTALPKIPGIRAEVEPITVFPRGIWQPYKGP